MPNMAMTPETRREYNRRWREANRKELAEYRRHYYAANREKEIEKARRYDKAHREELAEKKRRYREANPEKVAAYNSNGPTYSSWRCMLNRCRNPNRPGAKNYSGSGITICARWDPRQGGSFANFLADMGERPEGQYPSGHPIYSLDRFPDPYGNYEPENSRWATMKEQRANRRTKWSAS